MEKHKTQIAGLEIYEVDLIGDGEKGATHTFHNDRTGKFILGTRNAGTFNGNHYHSGKVENKNPEVFMLLKGKVRFQTKDLNTGEMGDAILEAPLRIHILPFCWHAVTSITDIVFLELNSIEEHAADTEYEHNMKPEFN